MKSKIEELQNAIEAENLDAMIISDPANIFYITGINNFDSDRGFLLVVSAKGWKLVTSRFYQARAEAAGLDGNVIYVEKGGSMSENAALAAGDGKRIGFEPEHVSYARFEVLKKAFKKRQLVPHQGLVERLRLIKSEDEFSLIKKAAAITDRAFLKALPLIKPGTTEIAVKRKIIEMMQDMGAQGGSFDPIIASGKNSADPHYEGSNKRFRKGEMVVIDIGARYKNYDADMTRTVFIGKASPKFKKFYDIVLRAQLAAIDDCRIGAPVRTAYENCVANLKKSGQDGFFTHGLGHGVGINIHEEPSLSPAGTGFFEEGMVFTVEPGIYHPGWGGIRIEDLCASANGKTVILSKISKELIEL